MIFDISLVSVASSSWTFWYLRSKVEFVPLVRRTEAPGIARLLGIAIARRHHGRRIRAGQGRYPGEADNRQKKGDQYASHDGCPVESFIRCFNAAA